MEYRTKSGHVLTEDMIEELAEAAERGDYPGTAGKVLIAPPGRPRISSEDLVTIAFKVPRSYRDRLDGKAAANHQTRSQFMRDALELALNEE